MGGAACAFTPTHARAGRRRRCGRSQSRSHQHRRARRPGARGQQNRPYGCMTRQLFLFLSRQRSVRKWMETSQSARKLTRRFVAGETLEQVVAVCERLRSDGFLCSLDHLGENVTSLEEAAAACDAYLKALDRIAERRLNATISLKLTQMGLDFSEQACLDNVRALVERARAAETHVEIDMESTAYTDRTLDFVEKIAAERGCVRAVIQAYLFRSVADTERMNRLHIPVRLVKGAYLEPESAAFANKIDVDRNYLTLMKTLLGRGDARRTPSGRGASLCARAPVGQGQIRVSDAVWNSARFATAAGGPGMPTPRLCPLRHSVVSLPDAPAGGAARQLSIPAAQPVSMRPSFPAAPIP